MTDYIKYSVAAVAISGSIYATTQYKHRPEPKVLPPSFTIEVDEDYDPKTEGKPRQCYAFPKLVDPYIPGVNSLYDSFLSGHALGPHRPYHGTRVLKDGQAGPYVWQTYDEVLFRINNFAAGLVYNQMKTGDKLGFFAPNRSEWVIAEVAAYRNAFVTVPLYETLGKDAIIHIINQAEIKVIVATADKLSTLLSVMEATTPLTLVIIDPELIIGAEHHKLKKLGGKMLTFEEVERMGSLHPVSRAPANQENIATICYTSGTTGMPKGVVLTEGNFLAHLRAVELSESKVASFRKDDVYLSYLPMAHIMERIMQVQIARAGAKVGFFQGSVLKVLDDVQTLQPTIFVSVPRVFNKIYDKVMAGVRAKGGLTARLFHHGYAAKQYYLRRDGTMTHRFWDALIFNKLKLLLGGKVRILLSGAAPISAEVLEFLGIVFQADIFEGYGQTETCGVGTVTLLEDNSVGSVGVPPANVRIKLRSIPDMGYLVTDEKPRGEIMIKGPMTFKEYYKEPGKTNETIVGGYVCTGDVGMWESNGNLKVIDRCKNIFKLAQGEYIAPEKIELIYQKHRAVAQAFVYGNSNSSFLVGIVVADGDEFLKWAKDEGFSGTLEELLSNKKLRQTLCSELQAEGKAQGLFGFENIKNLHLDSRPFTPENGLLSSTQKTKRHAIKDYYEAVIEELYNETK